MVKIVMLRSVATSTGTYNVGDTVEVNADRAEEFIRHGFARAHSEAAAVKPSKRTAARKGARKRETR